MDSLLHMSQWMLLALLFGGLLAVVFAVVGAVWVYFDAERLQRGTGQMLLWSFGVFLFFPLFLPLWLFVRPSESEVRGYEIMPPPAAKEASRSPKEPLETKEYPEEMKLEKSETPEQNKRRRSARGCLGYGCFFILLFIFAVYCGAWLASEHHDVNVDTMIRHGQEEPPPSPGRKH